jgi:hypothetical protein
MTIKTLYSLRAREPWEVEPFDTSELPSGWAETIIKLVESDTPVDDGDFPSKHARDMLIKHGYAAYVVLKGEQAGCVATYKGGYLYNQLIGCKGYLLEEAIAYRKTRPNFLNEIWKEQNPKAAMEECGACGYTADPDCRPCSS